MNNIIIEEVEFDQELYEKTLKNKKFNVEYEEGEENGDN